MILIGFLNYVFNLSIHLGKKDITELVTNMYYTDIYFLHRLLGNSRQIIKVTSNDSKTTKTSFYTHVAIL